jgi:hypothetical protein
MQMLILFLAAMLLSMPPTLRTSAPRPAHPPALNLVNARIYVEGEPVFGPFSVQQSQFGYLYLYVPGRGLYTIGAESFAGAELAGRFRGRRLTFSAAGVRLDIDSMTPILDSGGSDAWVRHEPNLKLNIQGVLYGYGDHPSITAQWLEIYGTGE